MYATRKIRNVSFSVKVGTLKMTPLPVFVCLMCLVGAKTLKELGIVTVNFKESRGLRPGQSLMLSRDHPHVIRACVAGDVRQKCFGDSSEMTLHAPGCELVDSDCTCYRWMFNSIGTNYEKGVTVNAHPTMPGCATILYRPSITPVAKLEMEFQLEHLRPIIPTGWLYSAYAHYTRVKRTNRNYNKPFFSYLYESSELMCGEEKSAPVGLAYNCKRRFDLQLMAVTTPHPEQNTAIFIPLGFLGIIGIGFAVSKLK